jgi:hypothetical protein
VKVPDPATMLQTPPEAEVALSVADDKHVIWSIPASAVGDVSTMIKTSSETDVQLALEMVHRRILFPVESPLTKLDALF